MYNPPLYTIDDQLNIIEQVSSCWRKANLRFLHRPNFKAPIWQLAALSKTIFLKQ